MTLKMTFDTVPFDIDVRGVVRACGRKDIGNVAGACGHKNTGGVAKACRHKDTMRVAGEVSRHATTYEAIPVIMGLAKRHRATNIEPWCKTLPTTMSCFSHNTIIKMCHEKPIT